jgi:hypothetical protein
MVVISKKKSKFVRVLIGNSKTLDTGIHKPIKTISIHDSTVNIVYKEFLQFLRLKK